MNEPKKENERPAVLEVTVTSSDGTEYTTRVRLYDLGDAKPPAHPPARKTAVNE